MRRDKTARNRELLNNRNRNTDKDSERYHDKKRKCNRDIIRNGGANIIRLRTGILGLEREQEYGQGGRARNTDKGKNWDKNSNDYSNKYKGGYSIKSRLLHTIFIKPQSLLLLHESSFMKWLLKFCLDLRQLRKHLVYQPANTSSPSLCKDNKILTSQS